MLTTTQLDRVFIFDNEGERLKLPDPDKNYSKEEVLNFYSSTYPALTIAQIIGPKINSDAIEFEFVSTMGTKG